MTEKEDSAIASQSASDPDATIGEELPSSDLIPGGIYKFISVLASGGAGVVYKAENLRLGKPVAIKMIRDEALSGSDVEARFLQEAKATSHLSHPNIVSIYEFGTSIDGRPFLVMEWIEGVSLSQLIKQDGPLSMETALSIFEQVCDAMTHAHKRGVLHRDLKPSNIMLTKDSSGAWHSHIIDFGIAKVTEHYGTPELTRTGEVFGTPLYMSPEQAAGKKVDHRSDVYSLGCLMFETLTGKPPYIGENTVALLMKHQTEEIPSINENKPTSSRFPESLDNLIRSLLAKEPEDRPESIEAIKKAFHAIRNPEKVQKEPFSIRAIRFVVKEKMLLAFLGCCIIGVVWACFMLKSDAPPPPVRLSDSHSGNHRESDEQARKDAEQRPSTEELNYENMDLTDEGLKYVSKMWNLKRLSLRETLITDKGVPYIANLPLSYLDISSTKITDASLDSICKIKTLNELSINETSIQGLNHKFRLFANLKNLEKLDMSRMGIKNEQVNDLDKVTSLKVLRIGGNPELNLLGITCFSNMKRLEELSLHRIQHIKGGIKNLLPLKRLKFVDLMYTDVEDEDLKVLARIRTLEAIGLDETKITDNAMRTLASASLPNLTELSIGAKTKVTEKGVDIFRAAHPGCRVFRESFRRWTEL